MPALRESYFKTVLLMTCRFLAGGALLLAAVIKLRAPTTFMLSIESFQLIPKMIIPYMAYAVPWTELIAGLLLLYGKWSRAAGIIAAGLYSVFILALLWVLWKELPADCGCFGGLFGSETVGWQSITRNTLLMLAAIAVIVFGGGAAALDAQRRTSPQDSPELLDEKQSSIMTGHQPS